MTQKINPQNCFRKPQNFKPSKLTTLMVLYNNAHNKSTTVYHESFEAEKFCGFRESMRCPAKVFSHRSACTTCHEALMVYDNFGVSK